MHWPGTGCYRCQNRRPVNFGCEDDETEIHIRLGAILKHYGTSFAGAVNGGFHLLSFAGKDAVLATVSRNGKVEPTSLYSQLLQAAGDIKPKMIGIVSAANVFAGNESDRGQVQQFIGLLTRIAIICNGSVELVAHPSLTGINSDTGLSGRPQWHNAVRARCYLKASSPNRAHSPRTTCASLYSRKSNTGQCPIVSSCDTGMECSCPKPELRLEQARPGRQRPNAFLTLLKRLDVVANRTVSDTKQPQLRAVAFCSGR